MGTKRGSSTIIGLMRPLENRHRTSSSWQKGKIKWSIKSSMTMLGPNQYETTSKQLHTWKKSYLCGLGFKIYNCIPRCKIPYFGKCQYSTCLAYQIQFKGSYKKYLPYLIWKAHAENKNKVFAWILIQDKILIAANLQMRGWPHHGDCVICNGPLEMSLHLLALPFWQIGLESSLDMGALWCAANL